MSESGANGRYKPRRKATRAASRGSRGSAARPTPAETSPPTPPEPPRYAPRTSDESPFWAAAQSAGAANESPFWANAQSTPGAGTQPIARPSSPSSVGTGLGEPASSRSYNRASDSGPASPRSYSRASESGLGDTASSRSYSRAAAAGGAAAAASDLDTASSRSYSRAAAAGSPSWVTQSTVGSTEQASRTGRRLPATEPGTEAAPTGTSGSRLAGAATTTAAVSGRTANTAPASGGGGRGGSRAAARSAGGRGSGVRRPLVAIASVVLVITPISWILLHEPQNDDADASIPIVTRTDDTYVTPTTKPVVTPPSSKVSTPPAATPTPTPTDSATPTSTPSTADPTDAPTSKPTEDRTTEPTQRTPTPDRTTATRPTPPPTTNTPPPPPARDGGMNGDELQLFDMIDAARVSNGCAPLEQDPNLTGKARADAEDRAESGSVNSYTSSKTTAGGDNWSAQQAYDQMMAQNKGVVLNCNLKTLGVGREDAKYRTCVLPVVCPTRTRVAWVADFT